MKTLFLLTLFIIEGLSMKIKTCVSSDVCDKGVQVINMGQQGKVVAHLKCCEGDECRNVVHPDMLTLKVRLKGCANKALCDSLVGYEAMAPENSGDHAMRCTPNSSIYLQEFTTVGQWNDVIITEEFSGGTNTIPRWFGLFITILSGILLRKLLA
ncbi:putative Phospholipase A2 inhibitor subunit gamma B protein [Naja naja]|nr:putative Phospholipase A2 inhibitor subunit gamma B protein [Naja naja]